MAGLVFLANPDYRKQIDLIKQLHLLMAEGRGESEQAEALREEVYPSWGQLTPAEMERVNALSADLYMLEGTEAAPEVEPEKRSRQWLAPRLMAAWEQQDWETILALLRIGPDPEYLPLDRVAYFRGRGWAHFGHHDIAVLFFDYAAKLNPSDVTYCVMAMEALIQGGQLASAIRRATAVIADPTSDPRLVFQAADVLFTSLQPVAHSQPSSVWEYVIKIIDEALKKEGLPSDQQWLLMEARAHLEKGLCLVRLGQSDAALAEYAQALKLVPNHPSTLTARGILLYRSNRENEAAVDFQRAAQTRTPLALPYFFLAHWTFVQRNYSKCLEWCDEATSRTDLHVLMGNLWEWKAIASWELGVDPGIVRLFFERALMFAPFDDRLQQNYLQFLKVVKATTHENATWELDPNATANVREDYLFPQRPPYSVAAGAPLAA